MSLVAYGPFTDKMKISDPTSHDNVNHFWKMLSMVIPGSVTQPPFVAGNATNVSKGMPHTCTLLHTNVNFSTVCQEPHFDYQHSVCVRTLSICFHWDVHMSPVSHHVHHCVVFHFYIRCVNSIACAAGGTYYTVLLFNSYYTPLPSCNSTSAAKGSAFLFHCFTS